MSTNDRQPLGALPDKQGVQFRIWAPQAEQLELVLLSDQTSHALTSAGNGYYETYVEGAQAGLQYQYRVNDEHLFPDPASRFQPEGVHGPSMVVDPQAYNWKDKAWTGVPQEQLIFYELHTGTFSPNGDFAGVQERLAYLKELGVTAIELMPVADFPGQRNWGYDQAALFAPSRAYGRPNDLRSLVDAAHQMGLAVYLDVIYNHLGPDGAYVAALAPFFTDKYHTPWGDAINFDDQHSHGVRNFFIYNALHWMREYHFDGLRLDATFAIEDHSETHFLAELATAVTAIEEGPPRHLIAEDHRNLNTLIHPQAKNGYGLNAMWIDDFHHQMRNLTAGDTQGYYGDFADSTMPKIAQTVERGWYFDGDKKAPASGKRRGSSPVDIRLEQCVFFIQNHDQIGNRATGNRLTDDISLPVYRAISALMLFLPELPLLFMGQEWAATTPFQYFTDHNQELGEQVRKGRLKEFEHLAGFEDTIPDPQAVSTFQASKLKWEETKQNPHQKTLQFYKDLLAWRGQISGKVSATAHSDTALTLQRDNHQLVVTVAEDIEIPCPAESKLLWHTEQAIYAPNSQAMKLQDTTIYFPAPGAALLQVAAAK